eukprot:scaffold8100_cov117-Isochrysis_galbana.AAC.5
MQHPSNGRKFSVAADRCVSRGRLAEPKHTSGWGRLSRRHTGADLDCEYNATDAFRGWQAYARHG